MRYVGRTAVAVAVWSLQGLSAAYWVLSYQYADDDAGLAVRLARECVERGACPAAGTPTSGLGLSHGASWIRLIGYCLRTGGGLATVQRIVLVLLVAATIASSIVAWRALSWRAGMFTALLVLPATMATLRFDDLTNGTLMPLPLALYWACTAWFVQTRRTPAALGASVFLAGAMSPSLSCIVMVPFHVALVALVARRPLAAATGSALAVAATFAAESSTAAAELARVLLPVGVLVLGLLVVIGFATAVSNSRGASVHLIPGCAGRWRDRLVDMPAPVRLRVAMKLAATYVVAVVWVGAAIARRIPDAHFFAPAVFPFVFVAADATGRMPSRTRDALIGALSLATISLLFAPLAVAVGSVLCVIAAGTSLVSSLVQGVGDLGARPSSRLAVAAAILVCLMSLPDGLVYPRTRQVWPVGTAERMVRDLYASGFTFPQLMGALQGQSPYALDSMIANLDPELFGDPSPPGDETSSLLAMIVDPAIAARAGDVVILLQTPGRKSAVAIRSSSVLDRAHLRTCYTTSCADPIDPQRCVERDPRGTVSHDRPYFPVDRVERAAAGRLFSYQPTGARYCVRFFVPLRMSGSGESHWVRSAQLWPLRVRIRRVSGVSFDGTVPGPEVRLANDRPGGGILEVEASAHGIGPESDWLEQPPLVELTSANEALLDLLRDGHVTLR